MDWTPLTDLPPDEHTEASDGATANPAETQVTLVERGWRDRAAQLLEELASSPQDSKYAPATKAAAELPTPPRKRTRKKTAERLYAIEAILGTQPNEAGEECYIVKWQGYKETSLELATRVTADGSAFSQALCARSIRPPLTLASSS